jgi:hypothetical protein
MAMFFTDIIARRLILRFLIFRHAALLSPQADAAATIRHAAG